MTFDQILKIANVVGLLLGTGLLGLVLRYSIQRKQLSFDERASDREDDRVDFEKLNMELRKQRDEFKAWASEQSQRSEKLEAEITGLRLARDLDPFPNWVVDRTGEYLYVNREFERHFLEPRDLTYRDAIGKTHETLGWPAEFCNTLKALNAAAAARPDGTARAVTALDVPALGSAKVTVHKFPIRFKPSGVIVAYAGYITDIEPMQQLLGRPE